MIVYILAPLMFDLVLDWCKHHLYKSKENPVFMTICGKNLLKKPLVVFKPIRVPTWKELLLKKEEE